MLDPLPLECLSERLPTPPPPRLVAAVDDRSRAEPRQGSLFAMRADRAVERLGGVADTASLLRLTTRARLRWAVRRGLVIRTGRGRYASPGVDEALRASHRLSGVLVEDSAAQYHGWEMKHRPASPCMAVPRNRNVLPERRRGVRVRWVDLAACDVSGQATGPGSTVTWCAARLPFDEALAIADSALRHLDVTKAELLRRAGAMPDRYRARCLHVAEHADGRAANPFESVLRAIALGVDGLDVEPQVWVDDVGRPDLLDRVLGLVIEADSFEFHGRRRAMKHDCERYNAFVVGGRLVLRFSWEHVMLEPDYVRRVLVTIVERGSARPLGRALQVPEDARLA
jgi:very-short-patch-repair endonuclease